MQGFVNNLVFAIFNESDWLAKTEKHASDGGYLN